MTAIVGREDNLVGLADPIVGDIEQITDLIVQAQLPFFLGDVLADHDHAILLLTGVWAIGELGHLLALQAQDLEATLAHDLVLDVVGPVTQAGHGLVTGWALQLLPGPIRQLLGPCHEIGFVVIAEDERDSPIGIPAIKVFGLREVGIAAQAHALEAAAQTGGGGSVESVGRTFMGGTVAGAIDDAQDLTRVGQGHDEDVITPDAVVGDVHAPFALARGRNQRAVGVKDGLLEEGGGLVLPDANTHLIENILQAVEVGHREASAEIASRGGIGDALGAKGVKIIDIVASQFDVLQAIAVTQGVEGDVEDVIGF